MWVVRLAEASIQDDALLDRNYIVGDPNRSSDTGVLEEPNPGFFDLKKFTCELTAVHNAPPSMVDPIDDWNCIFMNRLAKYLSRDISVDY